MNWSATLTHNYILKRSNPGEKRNFIKSKLLLEHTTSKNDCTLTISDVSIRDQDRMSFNGRLES